MVTDTIWGTDSVTIEHGDGYYKISLKDDTKNDYHSKFLGKMEELDGEIDDVVSEIKGFKLTLWLVFIFSTVLALVFTMFYANALNGKVLALVVAIIVACWLGCYGILTLIKCFIHDDLSYKLHKLLDRRNRLADSIVMIPGARDYRLERGLKKFFNTGSVVDRFDILFWREEYMNHTLKAVFGNNIARLP